MLVSHLQLIEVLFLQCIYKTKKCFLWSLVIVFFLSVKLEKKFCFPSVTSSRLVAMLQTAREFQRQNSKQSRLLQVFQVYSHFSRFSRKCGNPGLFTTIPSYWTAGGGGGGVRGSVSVDCAGILLVS